MEWFSTRTKWRGAEGRAMNRRGSDWMGPEWKGRAWFSTPHKADWIGWECKGTEWTGEAWFPCVFFNLEVMR